MKKYASSPPGELQKRSARIMKKEYDFKKMKKVGRGRVVNPKTAKVQTSIRLDGDLMNWAQTEAKEIGLAYQTFINMKLREVMEKPSIIQRLEAIERKIFKKV
jgi:uncharacterized protein (DUF4415 family)